MSEFAHSVQSKCPQCGGTGTMLTSGGQDSQEVTCTWPGCVNGWVSCGQLILPVDLLDIVDKLVDIKQKVDEIKDVVDAL